jgi:hypothetical protein
MHVVTVVYSSDGHSDVSRPSLLYYLVAMSTVTSAACDYYGV